MLTRIIRFLKYGII